MCNNSKVFKSAIGPSITVEFHIVNNQIQKIELTAHRQQGTVWMILPMEGELSDELAGKICMWMEDYISKKATSVELPLIMPQLPGFTMEVLHVLKGVPFGSTLTYGDIADKCGHPHAARAAGIACGRNPFPLVIPCHRVLASGKKLGGYSLGVEIKQCLLYFEGNPVV